MGRPTPGKTVVSDEQNKRNKKNEEVEKQKLEKYKTHYKNILWIDDECGDNIEVNLGWLNNYD